MKKINVKTDVPYFRPEQFEIGAMPESRETLIMKLRKEDFLSESFAFTLFSRDINPISYELSSVERKYLCSVDSFYIVVEAGTKGFETERSCFQADVKEAGDEITVTINPVDDADLTGALYTKFAENEASIVDCFNETVMSGSSRASKHITLKHIKMIEGTDFIRLPYKGNRRKLEATLNVDGKIGMKYRNDYRRLENGFNLSGEIETGSLFYRRDRNIRNMVEIVKLINYVHDFEGMFWAVVETVYTYPADAEKIKAAHPEFFEKECTPDAVIEKRQLLERVKDLPHVRSEYRLGDGVIHVPVDMTAAVEISIPVGEFHFILGNNAGFGHLNSRETGRLRLNNLPLIVTLAEVGRRYKLLYYTVTGFVKCEESYYAELRFERQSKCFDSLDADILNLRDMDWDERAMDKNAVACAGYLMFRGMIQPVELDKDNLGPNITEE